MKFTFQPEEWGDVRTAYFKYKKQIYYDLNEVIQRRQIAIFETGLSDFSTPSFPEIYGLGNDSDEELDFLKKFDVIEKALESGEDGRNFFEYFLDQISATAYPKKVIAPNGSNEELGNFVTNQRISSKYQVKRSTIFAELPVELHIIATLWIMKYGYKLDRVLSPHCLGNRLILTTSEDAEGLATVDNETAKLVGGTALFKPYFRQYQKWRDEGILEARERLSKGENIAIISLDVKNYFYSISIDFSEIEMACSIPENDFLHSLFKEIHYRFQKKLIGLDSSEFSSESLDAVILPIGLSSSYVLANWYLRNFDEAVVSNLRPLYYGRYVDDILIVISNPELDLDSDAGCEKTQFNFENYKKKTNRPIGLVNFSWENLSEVERYVLRTLYPLITLVGTEESDGRRFELACVEGCIVQPEKTLLFFFDHTQSVAALDKLKHELRIKSSEFRDFPDSALMEEYFEKQAYHLIFDDSEGKIRTLKDYKENRYGMSVYLANSIFAALRKSGKHKEIESTKIVKLFQGLNTLIFYRSWEKVLTLLVITNNGKGFVSFFKHTLREINKIYLTEPNQSRLSTLIRRSLVRHLLASVELALSLNPTFISFHPEISKRMKISLETERFPWHTIIRSPLVEYEIGMDESFVLRYRRSNMVRHNYVTQPLLSFTEAAEGLELNLSEPLFHRGEK
ncbi:MAG TPA: RNA-directed DNA polymerase [Pyrinomonadaceae bacterium]|nr:RNA-directed DNA polymerase [Pyrinomonadaceae bacterium]